MKSPYLTLIAVLRSPDTARGFDARSWSALLATARAANLLGTLAERVWADQIPCPPEAMRHLDGARRLSERQRRSVIWEAHGLQQTLKRLQEPVTLLKGAAYVLADHQTCRGRLFGDIDILVPRKALGSAETQLMINGWVSAKTDPYDQRYYREWMHELPPMTHLRRGTVLDVHHTILPLTAEATPDAERIVGRAKPLPELPSIRIPCPEDLVIHSTTHFAHEGELHNGLRDLCDIDCLLRQFGNDAEFWSQLPRYAIEHSLEKPVAIGLTLARRYFHTPIPDVVFGALRAADPAARLSRRLAWCYDASLLPPSVGKPGLRGQFANLVIYIRSHALRMPLPMLIRHLSHKALRRREKTATRSVNN